MDAARLQVLRQGLRRAAAELRIFSCLACRRPGCMGSVVTDSCILCCVCSFCAVIAACSAVLCQERICCGHHGPQGRPEGVVRRRLELVEKVPRRRQRRGALRVVPRTARQHGHSDGRLRRLGVRPLFVLLQWPLRRGVY